LVGDNDGTLWALDRNGGADVWKQSALVRRGLTTPVVHGAYVVVGDREGYVHWIDSQTGDIKGRAEASDAIIGSPVVTDDGILLIQSVDGKLSAFSLAQ
jgi:outer membrane protein assembly factor BamB